MHSSAVPNVFGIYYRLRQITCLRIPELYSSSLSSIPPASLFTPVSLCQRLLSARNLRRCSHQTSAHLFVTAGWREENIWAGWLAYFYFGRSFALSRTPGAQCQVRGREKERAFPRLVFSSAHEKLQRTVFFPWFSSGVLFKGRIVGMNEEATIDINSFGLNNTPEKSILSTVTPPDCILN